MLRPTVSSSFVEAHRKERILDGLARAIDRDGYRGAKIAAIVQSAHCAHETFYDSFSGKADGALALLFAACPSLCGSLRQADLALSPAAVLAVEIAASARVSGPDIGLERALEAEQTLRRLIDCDVRPLNPNEDDFLRQKLPPGRHGLPKDFVAANQLNRLLEGFAAAVAERGYPATTVTDVTLRAAVSRRTFYEHLPSLHAAGPALLAAVLEDPADLGADRQSTLSGVVIESVAARVAELPIKQRAVHRALDVLGALVTEFGSVSTGKAA